MKQFFIIVLVLFISTVSAIEGPEDLDFRVSLERAEIIYDDKDGS